MMAPIGHTVTINIEAYRQWYAIDCPNGIFLAEPIATIRGASRRHPDTGETLLHVGGEGWGAYVPERFCKIL